MLKNSQKVLAIVEKKNNTLKISQLNKKLSLFLDDIKDPGNLGTIIRIADWYGIENVICSMESVDNYNPKVIQASMGAIVGVNVFYTNKINFFNIPGQCTLRIYTVAGDLVKTIEHSDGTSEQAWYQLNDNNQLVFTGVYIFHVESKFGSKIGKFVIIRSSTKSERDMGFYK